MGPSRARFKDSPAAAVALEIRSSTAKARATAVSATVTAAATAVSSTTSATGVVTGLAAVACDVALLATLVALGAFILGRALAGALEEVCQLVFRLEMILVK